MKEESIHPTRKYVVLLWAPPTSWKPHDMTMRSQDLTPHCLIMRPHD